MEIPSLRSEIQVAVLILREFLRLSREPWRGVAVRIRPTAGNGEAAVRAAAIPEAVFLYIVPGAADQELLT